MYEELTSAEKVECGSTFFADMSRPYIRNIKWSLNIIFKFSQNLAFARFARKNWTGARLLVLTKFSRLLACSDSRLLEIS